MSSRDLPASSPVPKGHIRVAQLHAVRRLIDELGGKSEKVFASLQLDPAVLDRPDNVLPVSVFAELLDRAAEETRCEHFGLLAGSYSGIDKLGLPGRLMLSCATVGLALEVLFRFFHLHNRAAIPIVRSRGDTAALGYAVLEGGFRGVHQLQDGAMAAALNIMRRLLGNTWCPDEVHLVTRDPRKPEAYAAFFGSPCRFNQACSELIFPASTLDLPVLAQSANPRDVVAATGDFGSQLDLADWPELVHRMVFSLLLKGGCNQTVLARSVGMTPRTLNRRLEQHGLSYRQILDDSRFSASRTLIRETDLPLEEIARALGYSRASSFTRAFTRWSGICPDLWRKAKRDVTR